MARLRTLNIDEMSPEMQAVLGEKAAADPKTVGVYRIWAQRPEIALAMKRFREELHKHSILSPRLIELMRLRIAFHNQCRSCMAIRYGNAVEDGVTEDLVCELVAPEEAPNLTERERAALRYADLLASNHLAISDATFDDLRLHFTEPEIVELCAHAAHCLGFGRVNMSLDMVDDLPERFHDRDSAVTPWGADAMVV
jgi:alkylhydroperoxidase family enzyme